MKRFKAFLVILTAALLQTFSANAEVDGSLVTIYVDKAPSGSTRTAQNLHVYHRDNSYPLLFSIVSTGRENAAETLKTGGQTDSFTPTGTFKITWMSRDHKSTLWDGAPMPYAIFFHGGVALHGVYEGNYAKLGSRASGGCVRQPLYIAKQVWDIVQKYGQKNVRVVVYDSSRGQMPRHYFH